MFSQYSRLAQLEDVTEAGRPDRGLEIGDARDAEFAAEPQRPLRPDAGHLRDLLDAGGIFALSSSTPLAVINGERHFSCCYLITNEIFLAVISQPRLVLKI